MQYKVLSCRFGEIPCFKPPVFSGWRFGSEVALALQGQSVAFPRGMGADFARDSSEVAGYSVEEVLTPLVVEADFEKRAHETEYEIDQLLGKSDELRKAGKLLQRLEALASSQLGDISEEVENLLIEFDDDILALYNPLDEHRDYWLKVLVNWMTIKLCQSSVETQLSKIEEAFVSFADAVEFAYQNSDLYQRQAGLKQALFELEGSLATMPEASGHSIKALRIDKYSFETEARSVETGASIISELEPEEPDVVRTYTVSGRPVVGLDDISAFRQEVLPTKIGLYHQEIAAALVYAIKCVGGFALHEAARAAGVTSSDSYFRHETFAETAGQPASVDWLGWFEMLHDKAQQEAEQARLAQLQAAKARSLSKVSRMSTGRALGDVAALRQGGVQRTLQTV